MGHPVARMQHLLPRIPQPRTYPVVRNIPSIDPVSPVRSFMKMARELGPIFRLEFPGGRNLIAVSSHDLVKEVCDETRFGKRVGGPLEALRPLTGDGLFTAHTGEPNWERAHRLLLPAFGPMAMRGYFDEMVDLADTMLGKWERMGPSADLDVADNMTRLTLDTIARCGFGYRFGSFYQASMHPFVQAMVRCLAYAGESSRLPDFANTLLVHKRRQFEKDVRYLHEVVDSVIQERKQSEPRAGGKDLLSLMLEAVDPETGEKLSEENIRYQIVTFLIAGHETTSGLLSFTLYQMLRDPDIMARAVAQTDRVLGDTLYPSFDQVRQLGYIDQCLKESLRLWPTAPAFFLEAHEPTTLAGRYAVSPEDEILVLTPMLHRDPLVWPAAERFDPDRFAPEEVARRSPAAWKPFGNGQRACIGRQFSLQEATLVLGMLLQRFEIADPYGYELDVKETLTLKPAGFLVRARPRRTLRALTAAQAGPVARATSEPVEFTGHGMPLQVLYGSEMGSSETLARRVAAEADARGWRCTVASLDEAVNALGTEGAVVIVTSSYNGEPPRNARRFCAWLDSLAGDALAGVRYSVFGCGNRDWATTYQAVPTRIDDRLAALGATSVAARGEADARGDFLGDFERWAPTAYADLERALAVQPTEGTPAATVSYVVETVIDETELPRAHGLTGALVVSNEELVDMRSPFGRSKRHIELRLPEGITYEPGDYLAVLPENPGAVVERAARRLGLGLHQVVVVRGQDTASLLPLGEPVTVSTLLSRYVELAAPATRKDIELLAARTPCPPEARRLASYLSTYVTEILNRRVSVLDLLEENMSCELTLGDMLTLLPSMKPRQYSISSSPRNDATRMTLTVAVVDGEAWSGRGRYQGTCTSFLASRPPGAHLAVAVRKPHVPFHPPEDTMQPIVLVAAGTGLAPFRGFLEDRACRAARGEKLGPAVLFFGCDHPDVDFLYRDELLAWQRAGVCTLYPAYCQAPEGEITFVQHRLWAERGEVLRLIENGARIYVCGDGLRMAPAVRQVFMRIHGEATGADEEATTGWMRELESSHRYLADVFG